MSAPAHPSAIATWISALRPKTLGASLCPVLVGAAVARVDGVFAWRPVAAALAGAVCLQVASNLANDLFDGLRGTDGAARVGPRRAVGSGLVSPRAMAVAVVVAIALAAVPAAYLTLHAGPVFAIIGFFGAISAVGYTAPPLALAYRGLGDVFVFLFFGPLAVAGTRAACDGAWTPAALVCGVAPGAIGVCLLATNNLRDEAGDRASGKRTIVVRFGAPAVRMLVRACTVLAVAVPVVAAFAFDLPRGVMAASVVAAVLGGAAQPSATGAGAAHFGLRLAMFGLLLYAYGIAFAAGSFVDWGAP
ncbi:MAG: 1,4-dihydroxy-2-naphthoate octaprenyltransferase [Planctomycetota bacterium]